MEKFTGRGVAFGMVLSATATFAFTMAMFSSDGDTEYHLQPTIEVLSQCKQPSKLLITNGNLGVECASGVRFENLLEGQ